MSEKIKIGLDIHGLVDYDPKFFAIISQLLVSNSHDVHIMTGAELSPKIENELKANGIVWTHFFSISDYYAAMPVVKMWRDERGRPWVDPELWNKAKGLYAAEHQLDLVLDDTQEYGNYFSTSFAFCRIVNKSGKVRGPKAVMPKAPEDEKSFEQITPIVNK